MTSLEDYITVPPQIAVIDFGGQYANLISKRIESLGVRAKRVASTITVDELHKMGVAGVVLSGGPRNVSEAEEQGFDPRIINSGIPVLGICYGMQLIAYYMGGRVEKLEKREDGHSTIRVLHKKCLCERLNDEETVWMSHGDSVTKIPDGFRAGAVSDNNLVAAIYHPSKKIFGVQYHPEVNDTPSGMEMLKQFVFGACDCKANYTIKDRAQLSGDYICDAVSKDKVFILVSGGVDSTVAAKLALEYLKPEQVYAIHVDNGFMRHDESKQVAKSFEEFGFLPNRFYMVNAAERFYNAHGYIGKDGKRVETKALKFMLDPETKRKIIGDQFILEAEAVLEALGLNMLNAYMMQGSLFTDLIESGSKMASIGGADVIKTHHNDTWLARKWRAAGKMIEPNAIYYKDDVRLLGTQIGLTDEQVYRQPFPGPGLAIRVICQDAPYKMEGFDTIEGRLSEVVTALGRGSLESNLVPIRTVGVQGDVRSYSHLALLTGAADWELISKTATQITKEEGLKGNINRVAYQLSSDKADRSGVRHIVPTSLTLDNIFRVREAHRLGEQIMRDFGLERKIAQIPFPLFPSDLSGTGQRSLANRGLLTSDWMTGRAAMPPYIPEEFFHAVTKAFLTIPGIGAVVIDVSSKPPATTCWE